MPNPITESEAWFDEYLDLNGYRYEVEPELGVAKRPDRVVERADVAAICEVKEFTTDAMQRRFPDGGSRFGTFDADEWLLNVRRAISDAAEQLEPLADESRPLVIVLANPHGVIAEIEGHKLLESMYGQLQIVLPINTETGVGGEVEWVLGTGGRLADAQAPWVSAVAGLHRGDRGWDWERKHIARWHEENLPVDPERVTEEALAAIAELERVRAAGVVPTGTYFRIDIVETMSESAVPLPRNIFDGPDDRRWIVNREMSRYELLAL